MPVTERVMGLGDWSVRLRPDTPYEIRDAITTPFSTVVITSGRLPASTTSDATFLAAATYCGVVLRPGPQLELGGCGLAWYLGDDAGGAGYLIGGKSISAGSLSSAVSTVLTGTAFTSGTVSAGSVAAWETGSMTRRDMLSALAGQLGFEWRLKPDRTVDVGTAATLYGASPAAVIARRDGPQAMSPPYGLTGSVQSTWDWEHFGSKVYLWTNQARGEAGGASAYRDPGGNLMTIVRGYEAAEAPLGSEDAIADWWLGQIDRAVRTVEVSSAAYNVTGYAPCGSSVWLYDVDQGLWDGANAAQYGGEIIHPVSARVVSVQWPVERGMSVLIRQHNGTTASYTDLTDWVEWEAPGSRYEVSTAAQVLAPPTSTPLANLWRPWQAWTPTWASDSATQPAIGNGSIVGRFRRLGTACELQITLTVGSTTTFGVGALAFILPDSMGGSGPTGGLQLGQAVFNQPGVAATPGKCFVENGFGTIWVVDDASPWANWAATAPVTLAAGDVVSVSLTLEVGA